MSQSHVTLLLDLGFGDSGKGTITDWLCQRDGATTVVRYNGGAQAAHNVVLDDGRHHTFAQFGSGTFQGAKTHLGPLMMLNPMSMLEEARELAAKGVQDPLSLVSVDERTLLTTPYQRAVNRLREIARGQGRHGSCGMGVGETMWDFVEFQVSVHAGDLRDRDRLIDKLRAVRRHKREQVAELAKTLDLGDDEVKAELRVIDDPYVLEATADVFQSFAERVAIVPAPYLRTLLEEGPVVFEGAQGVLLDEWFGFHPYTTWSTTSYENAERMLTEIGYQGPVSHLGVLRGYLTRHGAGPFPSEDAELTARYPDLHNGNGRWQEHFRVGAMDLVLARYALDVVKKAGSAVESLALTHLDRLNERSSWPVATSYCDPLGEDDLYEGGRLLVGEKDDLGRQERLTRLLERAELRYQEVPTEGYTALLEEQLGLAVQIASHGPATGDKELLVPDGALREEG